MNVKLDWSNPIFASIIIGLISFLCILAILTAIKPCFLLEDSEFTDYTDKLNIKKLILISLFIAVIISLTSCINLMESLKNDIPNLAFAY